MERSMRTGKRGLALAACAVAGSVVLTACGSGGTTAGSGKDSYSVAVLLASSQNGYNQAVAQGVKNAVKSLGADVKVSILDGGFNSDTQLSQLETAGSGTKYDGVIVVPNDGVSLAAGFPLSNNIPVATVLNPVGPNISDMKPQVAGVVSTVAVDPAAAAKKQAEDVVTYCKDIDPCKVTLLVGNLKATLDVTREKAYKSVLGAHSNIKVVASAEGQYDPDTSSKAIANVLQAHPDVNAILSNADQQTKGAQIALEDAGIAPSKVYLTGGGGTTYAVENVRNGTWKADYLNFPVSMGDAAMKQLYAKLTGGKVQEWVDADKVGKAEAYADKKTLTQTPDFKGEWAG
ncbi:sugar ABC transporter substrate-binding protein [Streptomyces sp. NPDC047000]|uniref:sugar ABC transporter substrate-binding protein n=1 Tax=Streptomyces sp. NPDC047000 TaxID=3155474 RepID=UPI0033F7709E